MKNSDLIYALSLPVYFHAEFLGGSEVGRQSFADNLGWLLWEFCGHLIRLCHQGHRFLPRSQLMVFSHPPPSRLTPHSASFVIIVGGITVLLNQFVALGSLQVLPHHLGNEFAESDLRCPA